MKVLATQKADVAAATDATEGSMIANSSSD
jgi:hypothetical protein